MHGNGKKLIAVLGMHRAGTSVAARALEVLGVELGSHLMEPSEDNPKGYWEDMDIYALDVEMLHFLDSDWDFLAPIRAEDVDRLTRSGFLQRAAALLQEKTGHAQLFGFKDPRLAKLLPFWKLAFAESGFKADYVISIRHPISVCKSLANRDGFEPDRSYLLWLNYTLSAFAATQRETRVVVDYDRLIQSPESELGRMARHLGLQVDAQKLELFKTEFVDNQLRHNLHTLEDLQQADGVPPLVWEVYCTALAIAADKPGEKDIERSVEKWWAEYSRNAASLVLADKLARRIEQLGAEVAQARHKDQVIAAKEQIIAMKEQVIAMKEQAIRERDQRIAQQNQTLTGMSESFSWKVTRPLRATKRVLVQLRVRLAGSSRK